MNDHLLIATRKGLFELERKRPGWTAKLIGFPGCRGEQRFAGRWRDLCRAQGRPFRRQTAPLGRRRPNLARARRAGISRRCRRCSVAVSNLDDRNWRASSIRTAYGSAPFQRACFAPTTAAKAGSSSPRCGTSPSASAGSAAAMMPPASTAFRPIRAIRTAYSLRFPAAACGRAGTAATIGRCSAKACSRPMCRRNRPKTARSRIRIGWCAVAPRPT